MKKIILLILIIFLKPVVFAQTSIAVFELDCKNAYIGIYNVDSRALTDRLIHELNKTGKFQIVERERVKIILDELKFQQTGVTSTVNAIKVGKILGVEQVLLGSLGVFGYKKTINARLINVENSKVVKTATYDFEGGIDVLPDIIKRIAYQLAGLQIYDNYSSSPTKEYIPSKTTFGIEWDVLSHFRNGYCASVWFGGSNGELGIRLRGIYAQKDIPQIFYRDGFNDGRINDAYGLFLDISQGNFNGLWGGIGIAYLKMCVGHEEEIEKKDYELASLAFSFGLMSKLISNFYLNLWVDTHIFIIGDKELEVGSHTFVHDDVGLDLSISLGWHF